MTCLQGGAGSWKRTQHCSHTLCTFCPPVTTSSGSQPACHCMGVLRHLCVSPIQSASQSVSHPGWLDCLDFTDGSSTTQVVMRGDAAVGLQQLHAALSSPPGLDPSHYRPWVGRLQAQVRLSPASSCSFYPPPSTLLLLPQCSCPFPLPACFLLPHKPRFSHVLHLFRAYPWLSCYLPVVPSALPPLVRGRTPSGLSWLESWPRPTGIAAH